MTNLSQMNVGLSQINVEPLVSVIVPSYNQGDYIRYTIKSVLNQDYQNWELIVVDGASTDSTVAILKEYGKEARIKWVSEPDDGPFHAYNKGLERSQGELVGFLESSDTYEPEVLSRALTEFLSDPNLALVGGVTKEVNLSGRPLDLAEPPSSRSGYISTDDISQLQKDPPAHASFFRRDIALAIGGMDEELSTTHTYFFFQYILEATAAGGRALLVDEHWGNFRRHPNSISDRYSENLLKQAIERRVSCTRYVNQYCSILTPSQAQSLLQLGYYGELGVRVVVKKQIIPAIPALWGYLRNGGLTANRQKNLLFHLPLLIRSMLPGRHRSG